MKQQTSSWACIFDSTDLLCVPNRFLVALLVGHRIFGPNNHVQSRTSQEHRPGSSEPPKNSLSCPYKVHVPCHSITVCLGEVSFSQPWTILNMEYTNPILLPPVHSRPIECMPSPKIHEAYRIKCIASDISWQQPTRIFNPLVFVAYAKIISTYSHKH